MYMMEAFTVVLIIGLLCFIFQSILYPYGKGYCKKCEDSHYQWGKIKDGRYSSYHIGCLKCERRKTFKK